MSNESAFMQSFALSLCHIVAIIIIVKVASNQYAELKRNNNNGYKSFEKSVEKYSEFDTCILNDT